MDKSQQAVKLFREFLNFSSQVFDSYQVDEDNIPLMDSDNKLSLYKSEEFLEWMGKVYKFCKEEPTINTTKEDDYDYLKGKNSSIEKLQQVLGLEL